MVTCFVREHCLFDSFSVRVPEPFIEIPTETSECSTWVENTRISMFTGEKQNYRLNFFGLQSSCAHLSESVSYLFLKKLNIYHQRVSSPSHRLLLSLFYGREERKIVPSGPFPPSCGLPTFSSR